MDHRVLRDLYCTQQYNSPTPTMLRVHGYGGHPMAYLLRYQQPQLLHNDNGSRSEFYYRSLVRMSNYTSDRRDRRGSRRLSGKAAGDDLSSSAETISRDLKTRRYGQKGSERAVCAVCLDEFEKGQGIGTLQCGHEYHSDCIRKWVLEKNTCPTCRAPAW